MPVQLVVAASAARLQLTARVGLETLPPIAHATATTIALPRRVEGSRSPPHDEVGVSRSSEKSVAELLGGQKWSRAAFSWVFLVSP